MRKENTRPNIEPGSHPIERGRYKLLTPMIEAFYDNICQWISNRTPGGIIFGKPRLGKTTAIRYLVEILPERFGNMPIVNVPCREYKIPSERIFFSDMLMATGHSILRGDSAALRNRIKEFLYEKAQLSSQDRIIFFLDEAQKLHEQQYKWLIDLYNELDSLGVTLIVLLVGQEQLIHQYSAFSFAEKEQIIGRFMLHRFQFEGLKSVQDLSECLRSYDDLTEYPEGSGWSYTRYFFPTAFSRGWRLAESAEDLWKAFTAINEKWGVPGKIEIPMQYFCRTVEHIFLHRGSDKSDVRISVNTWKQAILTSGYMELEDYQKVSEEEKRRRNAI